MLNELTPAAAWRRVVEHAIAERVDAVVLAGDVVESSNARYEAFGHLEQGVGRLVAAGVDVCAVAGNHDVETLPRLARQISGFHLLGEGGCWEEHEITQGSRTVVRLLGWSFPAPRHDVSPFDEPPQLREGEAPLVGLLHCDLSGSERAYAPVRRAEFDPWPVSAWLLGHVHKPSIEADSHPLGYLGSLVGLDPGEPGYHSAWLLCVGGVGPPLLSRVPLSPLRWERLNLDVSALAEPEKELHPVLVDALRGRAKWLGGELAGTRAMGVRVTLSGRSPALRALRAEVERLMSQALIFPVGETLAFVEKIINDARAEHPLDLLAQGNDPPALLAQDLQALHVGGAPAADLLAQAARSLRALVQQPVFRWLDSPQLDEEELRRWLIRAGEAALDELLTQKEPVK